LIVLDTHVWIWWVDRPERLSQRVIDAIAEAESDSLIRVSVISVLEIAVKVAKGKLDLPLDVVSWVTRAANYPGIVLENLSSVDAIGSTTLPQGLAEDPFDRILVALTRRHGARLATVDERIRAYPHVRTIS